MQPSRPEGERDDASLPRQVGELAPVAAMHARRDLSAHRARCGNGAGAANNNNSVGIRQNLLDHQVGRQEGQCIFRHGATRTPNCSRYVRTRVCRCEPAIKFADEPRLGAGSLIAPPLSTVFCLLPVLSPYQGHGSLRGRRKPPQHLVRSTGAAMSTTGSRGNHAAQRPPSQPACTLAPVGNSHPRRRVARVDLVKGWSGARGLLRPAERLAGPPDAVQDHGQLAGERHTRLART
jgi:hypothetical protein